MSDFLGKDLKLNSGLDIEFTAGGDFECISGAECVAQDIRQAIAKSDIVKFLNDDNADSDTVRSFIEDILFDDPRVDTESIEITVKKIENGNEADFSCEVYFNTVIEDNEQNLVFLLSEYIDREKIYE